MAKHSNYSARILAAMAAFRERGQFGHMTKRELAARTELSYETIRRICTGDTKYVSEDANAAVCHALKLDRDSMWRLLVQEKASERFGIPAKMLAPRDPMIRANWDFLTPEQQDKIRTLVDDYVSVNRRAEEMATAS